MKYLKHIRPESKLSGTTMAFWAVLILACMLFANSALAALSCDPKSGVTTIGLEWLAKQCIPDGVNYGSSIYYENNAIECNPGPTVDLFAWYGDDQATPASIANYWASNGYRVFINREGSHIVAVDTRFTGLIDGNNMGDLVKYPAGSINFNVFKEALYPTSGIPDCKGGDFNTCPIKRPAGSTVNMGTGGLSHSQEVFTLNGSPLPLSVSLYYSSIPFAPSNIGNGWSHSYEATLQGGTGYNMVFWNEGERRLYSKYSSSSTAPYVSPKGDYSTLVKNGDNTWTITELDGLRRNFDTTYKLTSITDRYNNTLTFAYTSGKLNSVTDANGRSVTFGYNGSTGKLETITDPKLNVHTLGYTGNNLTSVTPPGNKGHWSYTYNTSNGLLETKKDPADNTSSYTYYSSSSLVQSATDPNLKQRGYTYPTSMGSAGKIPDYIPIYLIPAKTFNFVEKDGNGWTYTFDTLTTNVRTATDPLGKTTTYYYNTDGTLRARKVPFNGAVLFTTFYAYDSNGNLTGVTDPLDLSLPQYAGIDPGTVNTGNFTATSTPISWAKSYTYDSAANYYQIKTITDNRGTAPLTTTYDRYTEPDGQGGTWQVTRTTAPGETTGSTLISYQRQNASGQLASITDANNKTTTFTYYPVSPADNTSGMLQTVTTPDNIKLTYTAYDKNGNPTESKLTDTNNADIPVKSTQGYDTLNQIISILKESTAIPIKFSPNLTSYGYDNNGNRNSLIDAENHETKYEFTYDHQIKKITNTVSGLMLDAVFEYGGTGCPSCNGVDKLTAVKDPNHVKNNLAGTVYKYDAAGRLERETDPIGKILRYTYYDNGLLKERYDATGGDPGTLLVTYLYNNRGQLTDKLFPDNTSVDFTYRPNGWLDTAKNMTGSTITFSYTFDYYANGRLKSVTDSNSRTISYDQYDALGQKKQVTILKGAGTDERVIGYDYDSASRLWHIKINGGTLIFTYGYDERGRRHVLDYPNGTTGDWEHDDLDRLTSITHSVTGGTAFASYSYPIHDQVGNVLEVSGDRNATYLYDEIYRILTVTSGKPEAFTFDDAGNRKTGPGPMDTAYLPNDANQITTGRKLQYGYDNRGNQTTKAVPGATDKTWTQTWDYEDRLIKVEKIKTLADGTERKTVTFKYDPFGRRIGKTVEKTSYDVASHQYVTTMESYAYIYDGDDIALEIYTPATGPQEKTYYTHGPGIDEPLALERDGAFNYYHADALGSIVKITNAAHGMVQSYEYESFGMATPSTKFRNSLQFTGREYDAETGMLYLRSRYLDLMEGRFISKDLIGFKGGINLYSYTSNNPLLFTDPFGFAKMCCRLLNSIAGSWLGQRHCYIVADDGTRYGLYPENGLGVKRTNDPRDTGGTCYDCPALDCKKQNKCLRDAHNAYPTGSYYLGGPNSNTYAGTLARSCCKGGVPCGVHDAPGIGESPPHPGRDWI